MGSFSQLKSRRSLTILLILGFAGSVWFGWTWQTERLLVARAQKAHGHVIESRVEDYVVGSGGSKPELK